MRILVFIFNLMCISRTLQWGTDTERYREACDGLSRYKHYVKQNKIQTLLYTSLRTSHTVAHRQERRVPQ